jgi:ribosomal protein L24
MAHYQHSNFVTHNPEKKVIRESLEIHASKVALTNGVRLWRVSRLLKERAQLLVEIIR